MRTLFALSAALLLVAGPARAADDDAKAILEKAIKAHGGADKLTKFKAGTMKGKGKVNSPVGELEFTQEASYQLPDKFKEVAEFEVMGNKVKTVTVINGDKMSLEANGMNIEIKDELKTRLEEAQKWLQFGRLVPLRDKKFELALVGDAKVLDKPAVGIRVSAKGMKDMNLFFDKKSGLLVKTEARTVNIDTKQEVTEERIIADYKMVDGMALPQKILINHDGKKYMELNVVEAKFLEKIDDAEFKKE